MRIIHLSDFHLDNSKIIDISDFITKALIEDLERYNNDKTIDLILFSGDMIDKGGISFGENINEAFIKFEEIVINPILASLGLDKSKFIFVPGNHDIEREQDSNDIEAGLLKNLMSIGAVSAHIDSGKTEGTKRIIPFKSFEKKFHASEAKGITNYQSCYVLEVQGKKIGITGFNTAWRCFNSNTDNTHIILGVRQISEAGKFIADCDIKIALMHHQLDCLADFDKDVVQPYIEDEYDMLFCGHIHKGSNFSRSSMSGDIFTSIAPSNTAGNLWNDDQRYINGYSIIDYDFNAKTCTIHNRKYSYKQRSYVANTDLASNNGISVLYKREQSNLYKKNDFDMNITANMKTDFNKDTEDSNILSVSYPTNYAVSDFHIKNNETSYKFAKNIKLFRKYSEEISYKSFIFKGINENIETIIFMMDKALLEMNVDDYAEICCTIDNFGLYINEISKNNGNKNKYINLLFNLVEWWLTKVYQLLKFESNSITISLDEMLNSLIGEIKKDGIDDIIEDLIRSTKINISDINQGNIGRLSLQSDFAIIGEIITSLLLPIYVNKELIIKSTIAKKISEIESDEIRFLMDAIRNEYNSHLLYFKGRENEILEVIHSITEFKYTIIKGKKEVGKSALICNVINRKTNFDSSYIVTLFSFKHIKSIPELVGVIVEQCNANIINKIDTEILEKIINDNIQQKTDVIDEKESLLIAKYEILKTYLNESLKRVIRECGEILLVIDSLELIDEKTDKIAFLFQDIPDMCHLLLCTGEKDENVKWIISNANLSKNIIQLNCIPRNEIALISGLKDEDGDNKNINDKIFKKTKGQVSYISRILQQAREENKGIDISVIEYFEEDDMSEFEVDAELCIDNNVLEEVVLLLAVFEAIQPISLEYIQLFLSFKNITYRMPKIKSELKKLGNQINDLRFKRVRLLSNDFAKFILENFFSPKDVEEFISSIFKWLSSNHLINTEFICKYIIHMQDSGLMIRTKYDININDFISSYSKLDSHAQLLDIGFYLFYEVEDEVNIALKFLDKASEMDNSDAKSFLGYIYSTGQKVTKDIVKAEKLLIDASDMNNMKAKRCLANLRFEGTEVRKDIDSGQKLLEEATILGSKSAKLDLALRLITGGDIVADINRGQKLMHELTKEKHAGAMRIMGTMYLYGGSVSRDVESGVYLLRNAIEKGDNLSKLILAKYLIRESELKQDITEGVKFIKELVEANDIGAKRFYSKALLLGLGVEKDTIKGISLLIELVETGDKESKLEYSEILIEGHFDLKDIDRGKNMLDNLVEMEYISAITYFGNLLIEGKFIDTDVENGTKQLYKASNLGDILAKRMLAFRFIHGIGVLKDLMTGKQLFKELISKGDIFAKFEYAKALLDIKDISEINKSEALDLLKDASFLGSSYAKKYLGVLMLDGKIVEKNVNKGLEYLNESISLHNSEAMRELGQRLMSGIDISKDTEMAEKLLRKAINLDDHVAKTILGYGIVLGEVDTCDISEGVVLLEESAKDESNAMRILGILLFEGIHVAKDKKRGEELLKSAIEKGDTNASLHLARLLLDGIYLNANVDKGREILLKMVEVGNESATIELSNRLIDSRGFDEDVKRGLELVEELSLKGNIDAKYEYAYRLIRGKGVFRNINKGEELLREAEAKGHEGSRRLLAQCLIDETLKQREDKEGIKLIEESIDANDILAMQYFGDLLVEGVYVDKNVNRGIQLYEKSIKGNNNEIKVSYAIKLLEGDIVPKDRIRGLNLLKESIQKGSLLAKYELVRLSINGDIIDKDLVNGLKLLKELVEDGDMRAKHFFALQLIYGDRIEKNSRKGMQLFDELVAKSYELASLHYADLLIEGLYIPKDAKKGEFILKSLIRKGNMNACYELAKMYLTGCGLSKRVKVGKERMKKAASSLIEAKIEYGIRLKKGDRISRDEDRGKFYIDSAIKNAGTDDLYNLGVISYSLKDYELATQLLYKAYDNGSTEAGDSLAYMMRRNEIKGQDNLLGILNLLEKGLYNNRITSIINLVLTLVKDEKSDDEWRKADLIIKSLDNCGMEVKWWYDIAKKNDDNEGYLVIGWLLKYNKISYFKKLHYKIIFNKVLKKGYYIPNWLYEDDNSNDPEKVLGEEGGLIEDSFDQVAAGIEDNHNSIS